MKVGRQVSSKKFYVYTLARPDGRVFYIGKGTGKRIHKHEWEARSGQQSHKTNIIRKIWSEGGEVVKQKVFETDNEQGALEFEIGLIAKHGRKNLANLNDGGGTNGGWRPTPETIAKRAAALTGKRRTEEQRRRISEAHKGLPGRSPSEETRRKIAESQRGKPKPKHSEEERRRKSERQKGKKRPPVSEETRRKLSESHKGKKQSADSIQKRVASARASGKRKERADKGKRRSEETRQKMLDYWKARKEQKNDSLS